jgi:hypothetical protein
MIEILNPQVVEVGSVTNIRRVAGLVHPYFCFDPDVTDYEVDLELLETTRKKYLRRLDNCEGQLYLVCLFQGVGTISGQMEEGKLHAMHTWELVQRYKESRNHIVYCDPGWLSLEAEGVDIVYEQIKVELGRRRIELGNVSQLEVFGETVGICVDDFAQTWASYMGAEAVIKLGHSLPAHTVEEAKDFAERMGHSGIRFVK